MADDIKTVEITLYFPTSLVISENVFRQTRYKKILCTVEIRHFGRHMGKRENGIVKSLRVVFMKDANTLDWMDWPTFLEKVGLGSRRTLGTVQEAIAKEVIDKLELSPMTYNPKNIVPRDILTEAM